MSFLDLPGFHALIQSRLSLRLDTSPLWSLSWLLLHMPQSRRTSPCAPSLPQSSGEWPVVSWEDWEADLLGVKPPLAEDMAFPWRVTL